MFNLPEPQTIEEARRQINTVDRAKEILKAEYTFWLDDDSIYVAVCKPGQMAASYFIDITGDIPTCNCPDFEHRGNYCKHTLAWKLWEATVEEAKLTVRTDGTYTLTIHTKQEARQAEEFERMMKDCEDEVHGCDPYAKY